MKLITTAIIAALCSPLVARATSGPYDYVAPGTENSTTYSFMAMADGAINAYYYGSTAAYTNTLSMLVNGVVTTETNSGVLNNKSSSIGQMVNLGSVRAGDNIVFRLNVLTTNDRFYSDKALNADGLNHVFSTSFAGDSYRNIPTGTYLAFEDLRGGGDLNYHDQNFVISNITATAPVPEPETYAMLLAGLGLMGTIARRRRARQA